MLAIIVLYQVASRLLYNHKSNHHIQSKQFNHIIINIYCIVAVGEGYRPLYILIDQEYSVIYIYTYIHTPF